MHHLTPAIRVLALLALLAAVAADPLPPSRSRVARETNQSFEIGQLRPYDRLLASRTIYKSSTIFIKHEEKVSFTLTSGTISYIKVDDLLRTGKNADVKIKSGGIGQREVTFKFKSLRGGKINYNVSIYGQ